MKYGIEIVGDLTEECPVRLVPECIANDGGNHFQLDVEVLTPLNDTYRQFIWNQIPEENEWESTSAMMDYLGADVIEMQLLGFQTNHESQVRWSLEFLFTSCGGMSEVSARLGGHWAEKWFERERSRIVEEFLTPFGFLPTDSPCTQIGRPDIEQPPTWQLDGAMSCPLFVPIDGASYASFDPSRKVDEDDSPFQINVALADSLDVAGTQKLHEDLKSHYTRLLVDGLCRCQLCIPDFNPHSVRCVES